MPFSPLPKIFLEDLRSCSGAAVVELGCADGLFSALLEQQGVRPWRLDRRLPSAGSVADLIADAAQLPLAPGRVQLLVAANLLRQLWPLPEAQPCPRDWLQCLPPSGRLYIFEDEPVAEPAAARNYRDLQAFLARLAPQSRRPLLPLAMFDRSVVRSGGRAGHWSVGHVANRWPADCDEVIRLLQGSRTKVHGEAARLIRAIRNEGLSYGTYWWACFTPEESQ